MATHTANPSWTPLHRSQAVVEARSTLALLGQQAADLQLDVSSLSAALAGIEREVLGAPDGLPRDAHERLVMAALGARDVRVDGRQVQARQVAFLNTVAHELRNPLMPLRLAALVLERARDDEQEYTRLQVVIKDHVAQVSRLVADLLDASRMQAGRFRLERTAIDICAVLLIALQACSPFIALRRQRLDVRLPPAPVKLLGDGARLVQAFSNLLEHASKWTPEAGEVFLHAREQGEVFVVTITHSGAGAGPATLPQLIDVLPKDVHSAVVDNGALEIGLAVVRELIAAHEGTVLARSVGESECSEFVVVLPLSPASMEPFSCEPMEPARNDTEAAPASPSTLNMRVMQ